MPSQSLIVKNLVKEISDDLNVSAEDFVREEFDLQTFTSAILKTQQLTQHLAKLAGSIKVLDTEIKDQVSQNHDNLLHQAINIETLEDMLDIVLTRISSLHATSERLRLKISTPFNELNLRILQLSRLQQACDATRRIKGILHHSAKLGIHMKAKGAGDIVKAAQCLNELEFLLKDFDHAGIEVIEKDVHFLHRSRHEVEEQAQVILDNSLIHQDQTQTATALQVFYSLSILSTKIAHFTNSNEKRFHKRVNELLDTTSLTLQSTTASTLHTSASSSAFPGRSNMPNVGAMSQFRAHLWANVDKLMDTLFDSCAQTFQLQQILEKKKDLATNMYYIDEVQDMNKLYKGRMFLSGGSDDKVIAYECICSIIDSNKDMNAKKSIQLLYEQWRTLTAVLATCLFSACNQSNYVKQTFQNEYPKLLKVTNDLWLRLVQMNPLIQRYQYLDTKLNSYASGYELLRKCFYDLENSYLNRSLSHLFDPINLIFSHNTDIQINPNDVDTYAKGVLSQMQTLQYDLCNSKSSHSFSDKIISNVCKSITLYANKCEQCLNSNLNFELSTTTTPLPPDNSSPNQLQLKNLDYVNATHSLYTQLSSTFAKDYKLGPNQLDKLNNSLKSLLTFEETALAPFIASLANDILSIILTMHQEDFTLTNSTSLYMKELGQVLDRACRNYLQLYTCKSIVAFHLNQLASRAIELFIRHASILRPISDLTRNKLIKDSTQLESIIQNVLCPKLTDLGTSYKQLKAFRLLLQNKSVSDGLDGVDELSLPASVILNYLFSFGPVEFKSPNESLDWSVAKYSEWIDKHPNEKERCMVVKTCLEAYANAVTKRNEKEFANIYPIILRLCDKSLQSL